MTSSADDIQDGDVSEKLQMDDAERFRDFAESASDWFYEMDAEFKISFVSDRIEEIVGAPPSFFLGKRRDRFDGVGGDEEAWRKHIADLKAHRPYRDFTYLITLPSGSVQWLKVSGKPIFDGNGEFAGYRGTGANVTAQIEAQERAKQAEALLLDAINHSADGIVLWDSNELFVASNEVAVKQVPETVQATMLPGSKFEKFARALAEAEFPLGAAGRKNEWLADRLVSRLNPDGIGREFERVDGTWLRMSEHRTGNGGILNIYSEITEEKRRAEEIRRLQSRFEMAFQAVPVMLVISDAETGEFLEVNDFWLRTLGYERDEVVGRTSFELNIWTDVGDRSAALEMVNRQGSAPATKVSLRSKQGDIVDVLSSVEVIEYGGGPKLLYVGRDITAQNRIEAELRAARDEAEFANRTKSEFLTNMSHELRTPLNAIIGFAEFMESEAFGSLGDERYNGYIEDIRVSGVHLLDLINDILDVSRLDTGQLDLRETEIDMTELVESCLRFVGGRAEEAGLKLKTRFENGLPTLRCDATKVKQIVLNLLGNSVKFTPRNGTIEVAVFNDPDQGGLSLSVTDTGIGIASEDIAHVLTVFGQVDGTLTRHHEGVGLGLPLSKALTELHDGELRLESEVRRGTTFTVVFPPERSVSLR